MKNTVTAKQVVHEVSHAANITTPQARAAVHALVALIRNTLEAGGQLALPGLGSFRSRPRKARIGRNPQTGATLQIPAGRSATFKPSPSLKHLVNGK